jgi:hypothetical protein
VSWSRGWTRSRTAKRPSWGRRSGASSGDRPEVSRHGEVALLPPAHAVGVGAPDPGAVRSARLRDGRSVLLTLASHVRPRGPWRGRGRARSRQSPCPGLRRP